MATDSSAEIARLVGLTPTSISTRLSALKLTEQERSALCLVLPAVDSQLDSFIDSFYSRLGTVPELNAFLGGSERIRHLKLTQRKYLVELFGGKFDWDYVLVRVRIGATHHRIKLYPQWYLLSYAHVVAEHIPLLYARAESPAEGLRLTLALLKSVFFDATLAIDAYGMADELAIRTRSREGEATLSQPHGPLVSTASGDAAGAEPRTVTRVRLASTTVDQRREFVGLSRQQVELLSSYSAAVAATLPEVLQDFYAFFSQCENTAPLVPPDVVPRLIEQVQSYWHEFLHGAFDRPYASSRMRIGVMHEQIGLTCQWYLIGLMRQIEGMMLRLPIAVQSDVSFLQAFVRGIFFDVAYVIDAYMEARTQTVLRSEGYANQLVAGLNAGVIVVDGNHRIVSVNRTITDILNVDSALLYRAPFKSAVPVPDLSSLLEEKKQVLAVARRSLVVHIHGRTFRVTAIDLEAWEGIDGRPQALVFDDISEFVRAADDADELSRQLASVVQSVDATLWQLDVASWTLDLVSAPVQELTGYRDVYFIGRKNAWIDCISSADRERFIAYCSTLPPKGKRTLDYRIVKADGTEIWVRTALRRIDTSEQPQTILGVTVDISNERLSELRLRELEEAVARDRAKSQLLATMSHEIRTPLTGVVGMLDYLMAGNLDGQVAPHVRTAHQSAIELLALLTDLLDLSKLEAGRMELHEGRFDLVSLIEGIQDLFLPQARAKGVLLQIAIDRSLSSAWIGDAPRLRQVLYNLLSNALKFTAHGAVELVVQPAPNGLRIMVTDSGVGVPAEKRSMLFEPFTQAHASWAGTGLGLSICRRLAELMGGSISYSPVLEGGSRFTVCIPLNPATSDSLPQGEGRRVALLLRGGSALESLGLRLEAAGWCTENAVSDSTFICFTDDFAQLERLSAKVTTVYCGAQRPAYDVPNPGRTVFVLGIEPLNERSLIEILSGQVHAPTSGTRYSGTVLVAEDNLVNQRVVTVMLERLGFDVDVVVNGALAVDAAMQKAYSLVIMDMLMPEMDGLEASRLIRAGGVNATTPIIALTGNAQEQDRANCLAVGINEVLIKPLRIAALRQVAARFAPTSAVTV